MSTDAVVHRYPRSRSILGLVGQDALLVVAPAVLALVDPRSPLSLALSCGAAIVLAVGVATLHHPSRVEVTGEGISFGRYGRVHRFPWRDVERIRVRRFLVGDRVLVRISPSTALRGRYWILDSIEGFPELLGAIEARAAR
jgi:hypothetical protein